MDQQDTKHTDPDRYALVIEGVRWEYHGGDRGPWGTVGRLTPRLTTDEMLHGFTNHGHAPAILDIVKRWHEDRRPRVQRRVVECDDRKFCVSKLGGVYWLAAWNKDSVVREMSDSRFDFTADQVRVMADLLANPDEPEPTDV